MDAEGWIPIAVLASFKRVRKLTPDPALVREVLALSALVEVRDDHVRMSGSQWVQFVLPDARPSAFAAGLPPPPPVPSEQAHEQEEEHEEEEEEVEFVVGPEATRAWTPTATAST